ncbi:unnamed protein product [Adineta steineri]|uniref:Uncharacterized protein n=2 Tax=Adineta steineri TaxID=433720 RepID=A0A814SL97_9BILA|nr:unnamed protein product [Adineta steineri]
MYNTNMHGRVYRRPSDEDDENICCCLANILSLIDLIPFLYLLAQFGMCLNEAFPPENFDSQNNQTQKQPQTWSRVFANCSYQQNSTGNYSIVCHADVESLSIFFLTAAFVLALALLLFNISTTLRKLTRNELIIRTLIHIIYAIILFTTALIYTLTRSSCSNCQTFLYICIIPIPTTICMTYNWYDCDEEVHPHQQRPTENQPSFQLTSYASNSLPYSPGRIVSYQQQQSSLSIPRRPPENNTDPQLENEFNEWLEAQQRQN